MGLLNATFRPEAEDMWILMRIWGLSSGSIGVEDEDMWAVILQF